MRDTSDHTAIDLLALAIIRHKDGVVMVQQQDGDLPPYWVLPSGLVEAGELVSDALVREAREEAGVQVDTISHLACVSQIDRPQHRMQTIAFVFEVRSWHGPLQSNDPDDEVLRAELVPLREAITRLQANGGWTRIQQPVLAYLRGDADIGAMWVYREEANTQHFVTQLP